MVKLDLVDNPDGYFEIGSYYKVGPISSTLSLLGDNRQKSTSTEDLDLLFCIGYKKVTRTSYVPYDSLVPVFITEKGLCSWGTDHPGERFIKVEPKLE